MNTMPRTAMTVDDLNKCVEALGRTLLRMRDEQHIKRVSRDDLFALAHESLPDVSPLRGAE